jgi:hypothetical protein
VENLSARASADLKRIIENENGIGTRYALADKGGKEYSLVGTFGDIASLVDPISGEAIQDRSIEATYHMETIIAAAGRIPERGWKVRVTRYGRELVLFVRRSEADRTIGLCRLALGINLKDGENGN